MEPILDRNTSDAVRITFLKYLSVPELLKLRTIYPNFDTSFQIVDKYEQLHAFASLTSENILQYRQILDELNQKLIRAYKLGRKGPEVVRKLLSRPEINVNYNKYGFTTLMVASGGGYLEIVKELLAHPEIDVNYQNQNGENALMWASDTGDTETVHLLLARPEIKVNAQNNLGQTALALAIKGGFPEIVQLLESDPRTLK